MGEPVVFFVRNRPQGFDAIDIALAHNRSFIGYPMWKPGAERRLHNLRSAIVDLGSDHEWEEFSDKCKRQTPQHARQFSLNRNLVRDVRDAEAAVTLIPRPDHGSVYAGRVVGFELCDNPQWADDYLKLRDCQKLDASVPADHVADVAQGWKVDRWREIPFSAVPAWIRQSLFGRSTVGRIGRVEGMSRHPYYVLNDLIEGLDGNAGGSNLGELPLTSDLDEIAERLLSEVGAYTFEHLVVALLQYEEGPEITWRHIGGSGDGNVDGMGTDRDGNVTSLLQCKWKFSGGKVAFESAQNFHPNIKRYVATLLHPKGVQPEENIRLFKRLEIAELVRKHAARLPWAATMRIGGIGGN